MVFGSAAPCFALLADGTRLYWRTAVRLYWPKREGRLCVYLMNVSMYRFCELYLVDVRDTLVSIACMNEHDTIRP